jgi:hypothetical protein
MIVEHETEELHRRARGHVGLERYAEILAHVVHFGRERLEELIPRFGLSFEQWGVVDEAWSREFAEGIRRQQHEQALRFSETFAKTRCKLAREQPLMNAIRG